MNYKDFLVAMQSIEDDRHIDKAIVIGALEEALSKAYRKHVEISDALVRVDIPEDGDIKIFRQFKVVEEVEDPELEVSLAEAHERDQSLQVDDLFEIEEALSELGRPAALLAKNVLKQKIREAEKQGVYDEFIEQLGEIILCTIETVEDKFIIVNLGKSLAMMPKGAQIPGERYTEGEKIRVVITDVNRDTKGAQILVSRSDAMFVRRLFEREVPEIYEGIVEIKAIARDAGERTKIAVYSKQDDIDPIGACIGPRGSRVHAIIEELKGEKMDIFEWSSNMDELVRNALSPAQITAVFESPIQKGLMVIVENDQLSLAIGKKGKNARLAVKLTGQKIDIKTISDVQELGIDYEQLAQEFQAEQRRNQFEQEAQEHFEAMVEETTVEEVVPEVIEIEEQPEKIEVEQVEVVEEPEVITEEPVVEEKEEVIEEEAKPVEEVKEVVKKKRKTVVKDPKERSEYVSKFEAFADTSRLNEQAEAKARKKRKEEEEERKLSDAELRQEREYEIKPEYTAEELEAIRLREEEEKANSWIEDDIDFDEYDEYYDFDE